MSGLDDLFLREIADRCLRENAREAKEAAVRKDAVREEASRLALAFAEADDRVRRIYLFGSVLPGKRSGDFLVLIAELESDVGDLSSLEERNRRALERIRAGARDELDWAALGYTLHNLYGLMENYFRRISIFFENGLDPSAWHRELLIRMTLEIPGVRPALFKRAQIDSMDDLRAFRHVFRNLYAKRLDPAKLETVQRQAETALALFRTAHEAFIGKLRRIAGMVGSD